MTRRRKETWIDEDRRFSRPQAAADGLGQEAEDRHRFLDKRVLLIGEPDVLTSMNGRTCFLASVRLLPRICRHISICVPATATDLARDAREIVDEITFEQDISFVLDTPDFHGFDAILSVGTMARHDLPWTVINASGWLARVSSGATNLPAVTGHPNPMAALAAASLGVTEVFKRLLRVKPSRGALLDGVSFSLFDYTVGTGDPGPELPDDLPADVLLIGSGAIGNGVVYVLSQLPISGCVQIVDRQMFQVENLGTCLLAGPTHVGTPKAEFAASFLRPRVDAEGFPEDIAVFAQRVGSELPYPRLAIGALDDVAARHAVQDMWPDVIIDGAIGDFACQVSRHPWGEDVACLRCLFRPREGDAAERVESGVTGLSIARVRQAENRVTEDDVRAAPAEKREWLQGRVGRQICSVVQEAVAQDISEGEQRADFEPSVPFVACLSASMIVGEAVKQIAGWQSSLEPRYQFDSLRGPAYGEPFPQQRRRDCVCVTRASNIEKVRGRRGPGPGSLR